MAQLKNRFFGELKGSFGDVVFRQRNGKNYTAKKPKEYTVPMDGKYQLRTAKFRLALKLASKANSLELLNLLWKRILPKGISPYQQLVSEIYPSVGFNDITGKPSFTPKDGFGVVVASGSLSEAALTVTLNPLTEASTIDPALEKTIMMLSIIFANSPAVEGINAYEIISVVSPIQPVNLAAGLTFTSGLSTSDSQLIAQYTVKKIYNTLITFDEQNIPVKFANTFMSSAAEG